MSGDVVPPSDQGFLWSASHVKAEHPGQIHFLRRRKIASRDVPVNNRDFRPRSITELGELMTTRRTWPIMEATIASNGSIATPAVVSHRRDPNVLGVPSSDGSGVSFSNAVSAVS